MANASLGRVSRSVHTSRSRSHEVHQSASADSNFRLIRYQSRSHRPDSRGGPPYDVLSSLQRGGRVVVADLAAASACRERAARVRHCFPVVIANEAHQARNAHEFQDYASQVCLGRTTFAKSQATLAVAAPKSVAHLAG
jgi:hypothetical protein